MFAHAFFSEKGPRPDNQDRILSPRNVDGGGTIAAIADGVGGAAGGGEAAQIAIEMVAESSGTPTSLQDAFTACFQMLRSRAEDNDQLRKMATTLSALLILDGYAHVAHVGDSRIYHIRGAGIKDLTEDQTELAELRRKGILTKTQALRYPRKGVLLSALSPKGVFQLLTNEAQLQSGDRLLLLTDGVHQIILRRPILELSLQHPGVQDFINAIKTTVEKIGPKDNFSALAIQV